MSVAGHFAGDIDSFNTFWRRYVRPVWMQELHQIPEDYLSSGYWTNINLIYTVTCEEYVGHLEAFFGVNRPVVDSKQCSGIDTRGRTSTWSIISQT
jgi:hypothetical protein